MIKYYLQCLDDYVPIDTLPSFQHLIPQRRHQLHLRFMSLCLLVTVLSPMLHLSGCPRLHRTRGPPELWPPSTLFNLAEHPDLCEHLHHLFSIHDAPLTAACMLLNQLFQVSLKLLHRHLLWFHCDLHCPTLVLYLLLLQQWVIRMLLPILWEAWHEPVSSGSHDRGHLPLSPL